MAKHNRNYSDFYNKHKDDVIVTQVKPNEIVEHTAEEVLPKPEEVESKTEEDPADYPTEYAVVSGASRVNLREAPNKDAKVIEVFNEGTKFMILLDEGAWYKVTLEDNEITGYMMKQYLKKV